MLKLRHKLSITTISFPKEITYFSINVYLSFGIGRIFLLDGNAGIGEFESVSVESGDGFGGFGVGYGERGRFIRGFGRNNVDLGRNNRL